MKKTKWMPAALMSTAVLLGASGCTTDWGQMDPPAGVSVSPKLENVATFEFEDESLDPMVYKLHGATEEAVPALAQDERKGNVLTFPEGSWVVLHNPLNQVTCQQGASLTFWMKQTPAVEVAEDGTETVAPQDLVSPLFSFTNENESAHLNFSANGWIDYSGADGEWSENDPAAYATGFMPHNQWNYVALSVRNDGYDLYVNGEKKVSKNVDNFDCSKLVAFMNSVPNLTVGSPDATEAWAIDDLKVYRNLLTEKEIARPRLPGDAVGPGGIDFATFDYIQESAKLSVGTPDCTVAWWSDFSNYFRIPEGTNFRITLINHTSGGGNWNNWNLCLCTDADREAQGYAEYFVIRSDLYGWGSAYVAENWSNEGYGDWDQFRLDMEGAKVVLDIRRDGAEIYVTATATAVNGNKYVEKFHATCGEGDQIVRAFLIADGSYLEIDNQETFAYWDAAVSTTSVGASDNSSGFWTVFSDYFPIPSGLSLHLGFVNYGSMGGNWNNWNLCVATDADRSADGYAEYYVIRSDLYGWGSAYNGDNWTSEGYGDWDQFRVDMNGAWVDLNVERNAEVITSTARAEAANGTVYKESIWGNCEGSDGTTVRAFLICDGSHFDMIPADCYTYKKVY